MNHPIESESRLNYIMTRTNSEKSKEKGKSRNVPEAVIRSGGLLFQAQAKPGEMGSHQIPTTLPVLGTQTPNPLS